jgi:hypothetical protein
VSTKVCDRQVRGKACGKPIEETQVFIKSGVRYELDLCEQHTEEFEASLAAWIEEATPTRAAGVHNSRMLHKAGQGAFTTKDVRLWLKKKGRQVPETGRIREDLIEEYKREMSKSSR